MCNPDGLVAMGLCITGWNLRGKVALLVGPLAGFWALNLETSGPYPVQRTALAAAQERAQAVELGGGGHDRGEAVW